MSSSESDFGGKEGGKRQTLGQVIGRPSLINSLKFFENLFVFYMYEGFACMCVPCVPGAHRGQKMASDLPELELSIVVRRCVGAGN